MNCTINLPAKRTIRNKGAAHAAQILTMKEDNIRRQLQQNIFKIGLLDKQTNRAFSIEHDEPKVNRLKKKQKKIIDTNNKLLLELEKLEQLR